jgi:uncharacterized protein (DUF2236 family)
MSDQAQDFGGPAGPHDWGLFGPGSATWKVGSGRVGGRSVPLVSLIGGLRALLIQTLHPHAMAGVAQHSDFRYRGLARLRNTSRYVSAVNFGDTATAHRAAARVMRMHERVKGFDPVTGTDYSASEPNAALWVHCTEIHSFLASYRAYAGHLEDDEQDAYLAEQVRAAELLGIPRQMVPASRAEYREYFASVRPQLCLSADSRAAIDWVLSPELPGEPAHIRLAARFAMEAMAPAMLALVPRDLRELMGVERSRAAYAVVGTGVRLSSPALRLPPVRAFVRDSVGSESVGLIEGALRNARAAEHTAAPAVPAAA